VRSLFLLARDRLQVIEAETPRETSTDKISALIERIRSKTRDDPDDPPSTH
jgi:hypothetical protein